MIEPDRFYTRAEAARLLGVHENTMGAWRLNGTGPEFVRIGPRRILYRGSVLLKWMDERSYRSRAAELAQRPTAPAA